MTEPIRIPDFALVVLVGASGSGKSTFAKKHFRPTEVLSSDYFRALVSDDENAQAATADAFETLHFVARKRLAARKLTVIDATNVQEEARKPLVALAREFHALPVAIALQLPAKICHERNRERAGRDFGRHVVEQQARQLRGSLRRLGREGFRRVIVLSSPEAIDAAVIERQRLWTDRRDEHGPFDIIGDVHGCSSEFRTLLLKLGYSLEGTLSAPTGRKAVFLGDLVDRGPDVPGVLRLVMDMVEAGCALCIPGNHDVKLLKKLTGRDVKVTHGLAESLAQLESAPPGFKDRVIAFLDGLVSHYLLNDGKLVVAHAGMKAEMQGRASGAVGYLEHPAEAFAYYRRQGVEKVVCEEKHMGSRAVVIVCRDEEAARRRFGVSCEGSGICYTRTGRRFFEDRAVEAVLLETVRSAVSRASMWDDLATDWACIDCELMPWSAKAQELLRGQYAAVGAASRAALAETTDALERAASRLPDAKQLLERCLERRETARRYVDAYRRYSWTVSSLSDLKLAPFHLLATEGAVHADKDHAWHMEIAARICAAGKALEASAGADAAPILLATPYRIVALGDPASESEGIAWWEELTARGGEGMVVKPFQFVARGSRGLVQPAVKCRGREYLRIIYGPEYTLPANLERLRKRGLAAKRGLALRELALGIEGLERFVNREPLRRVHECVFAVLALESEPVDPRL